MANLMCKQKKFDTINISFSGRLDKLNNKKK